MFGKQLSHNGFRISTKSQWDAVVAVGSDPLIVFSQSRIRPRRAGFLANVEVTKPFDFLLAIELTRFFLKFPLQLHRLVPVHVPLFRMLGFGGCLLLACHSGCFVCLSNPVEPTGLTEEQVAEYLC